MHQLLIIIIFLTYSSFANTLNINNQEKIYDNFELQYLKTNTKNINIEEISKKTFNKETSNAFTLSYVKGDIWFKFDINNKSSNEDFVFSLNEHFYEVANLFYFENNKWQKKTSSVFDKMEDREIKINENSFKIKVKKNKKQTFYLQINGQFSYFGKLIIYTNKAFTSNIFSKKILYLFIFALVFSLVSISFLLSIYLRKKIYFYYFAYTFFTFIYLLNINGFLVYLDLSNYMYKVHISSPLLMMFFLMFSFEFLQVKKYLHKSYKYLKYLYIPFIIFSFGVLFSYRPWNEYVNNYISFIMIILTILAFKTYFYNNKDSKYYIMIFLVYFCLVLLFTLMLVGVLEYNTFTRYAFMYGIIFENIAFLFYLISKYSKMQKDIISSKDELLAIKINTQKYLEKEVKNRTEELKQNNKSLAKLLNEKEFLIKELHHRVKNNFHSITGLLWLETSKSDEDKLRFTNIINRIKAMSNIHQHFYKNENINKVNLKQYLEDIILNLKNSHKQEITTSYNIEDTNIKTEDIVNLGIILNEVLTNSIKHNGNLKVIDIEVSLIKKEKNLFLKIKDSGKGFDTKKRSKGLGLELIKEFSSMLENATYSFYNKNGTCFELIFKIRCEEKYE